MTLDRDSLTFVLSYELSYKIVYRALLYASISILDSGFASNVLLVFFSGPSDVRQPAVLMYSADFISVHYKVH